MKDVRVVVLAGGRGTRLAPYTHVLPKPLMPVCEMPILEIVLRQLRAHGLRDIVISVGHLAELIMAFFGDGAKWDMKISYAIEDEPLGTIGPLRLIDGLDRPFLVMNGDLLTDIDYTALYRYHLQGGQPATVAVTKRQVQITLGVIDFDADGRLTGFREKPKTSHSVSMGIYVFDPSVLEIIPPGRHYGFDDLMYDMLAGAKPVRVLPFDGLWLDIGRHEDYQTVSEVFERHRERFLPNTATPGNDS